MALVVRDTQYADPAIYKANQLIYTATPIFVGVEDPVPERIIYREGTLLRPRILETKPRPVLSKNRSKTNGFTPGACYQHYRSLIGEDGFFEPIKQAVGSYFRTMKDPDPEWLEADLAEVINANADLRDPQYIQTRLNDLPKLIAVIAGKEESKIIVRRNNINELRRKIGI